MPNVEQSMVFTSRNSLSHLSKKSSFWPSFWGPKVGPIPQNTSLFGSQISIDYSMQNIKNINFAQYIHCFVRVSVFHIIIFFMKKSYFSCIAFLHLSESTFGSFWSFLGPSKSAPNLQKWCSRRGESIIFKKSWFLIKKRDA